MCELGTPCDFSAEFSFYTTLLSSVQPSPFSIKSAPHRAFREWKRCAEVSGVSGSSRLPPKQQMTCLPSHTKGCTSHSGPLEISSFSPRSTKEMMPSSSDWGTCQGETLPENEAAAGGRGGKALAVGEFPILPRRTVWGSVSEPQCPHR